MLLLNGETATGISGITNSMVSGFTSGASDIMSAISSILPVVIPIIVAVAVITIGRKIFKQMSKG